MRSNQRSALLLLCVLATLTGASAGDDRVELFQEVTAANTSDLLLFEKRRSECSLATASAPRAVTPSFFPGS
jgi:hypothetical protein